MESEKVPVSDYKIVNSLLSELHHSRRHKPAEIPKSSQEEPPASIIFPDGCSLFMTPIDFIASPPPHFLSLRQLLYEDLQNIPNRPKTLESALFTTFCVEKEFFQPILNLKIPTCLVSHSRSAKLEKISETFTLISPKLLDQWGSFHAKLFLLKFPERLRVVVTSANLMKCDWSLIGQSIWFQDFFKGPAEGNEFSRELKGFLEDIIPKQYNIKQELKLDLDEYDFSQSAVDLVSSVPGRFKVPAKYGLEKMQKLIGKKYDGLVYQCSSIGAFSPGFKQDISLSFTKSKDPEMNLIFPSIRCVTSSHLGLNGAGVFFLKDSTYEHASFPKNSLCTIEPPANFPMIYRHLSHSKILIAHNNFEIDDDTVVYSGSHNLSAAAWGRYEKKSSQLFIKNYELGVVFKAKAGSADQKNQLITRLPFKFPPSKYRDTDRPFFIDNDL